MIPLDNLFIKIVIVLGYTFVQLHYDEIFRLGAIALVHVRNTYSVSFQNTTAFSIKDSRQESFLL